MHYGYRLLLSLNKIQGVKYARIRFSLTHIVLYTGQYEWERTRVLAYFTPWLAS